MRNSYIFVLSLTCAEIQSVKFSRCGSKGARTCTLPRIQFLLFLCSFWNNFWLNNRLSRPRWVWQPPPSEKSWIHHCGPIYVWQRGGTRSRSITVLNIVTQGYRLFGLFAWPRDARPPLQACWPRLTGFSASLLGNCGTNKKFFFTTWFYQFWHQIWMAPSHKYFLCTFWGSLVTMICDVKIDVIICEPHHVNLLFCEPPP